MAKGGNGGADSNTGIISGNKRDNILTGTSGQDTIDGKAGNDTLFGLGGADILIGGSGNDLLDGGAGDDQINGGTGTDTAVFSGARDLYTVTTLSDGSILISGPDGTDTLAGVELFQFADITQTAAEVVVPRLANLSATSLSLADDALAPGESSTATFTLASNGNIDAGASSFELVVATSADASTIISVLDTGDATGLSVGESTTFSATIPADALAPGTYWVAVRADAGDVVTESNEGDNLTNWVQITVEAPVADLVLTGATLGGATDLDLAGGGQLQVTYNYENAGNTSPSYFQIRSYLSTDATISGDDIAVLGITGGTVTGQTGSATTSHYFQPDFAPGEYYLISEIFWGDGSADATPANNTIVQTVTFTAPPTDLAITSLSVDPGSDFLLDDDGASIAFAAVISNTGELAGSSQVSAFLSADGTVSGDDIALDLGVISVTADGTATVTGKLALDPSIAAGDYSLIVMIGDDANLANNSASFGVTLTAPSPNITGTEGADVLTGTEGDDLINALGGDDIVFATAGADTVDGGTGFDTADFSGLGAGIQIDDVNLSEGFALRAPFSGGSSQTYTGFESVVGTDFDDSVEIENSADLQLILGDGNDIAVTGAGDDIIDMGAGDDLVAGMAGNDTIILGSGSDVFGVTLAGDGHDVITDFDVAEDFIFFTGTGETPYDPLGDATQTAEGTLLSYAEGASVLLLGVDLASLDAANFLFDDPMLAG